MPQSHEIAKQFHAIKRVLIIKFPLALIKLCKYKEGQELSVSLNSTTHQPFFQRVHELCPNRHFLHPTITLLPWLARIDEHKEI